MTKIKIEKIAEVFDIENYDLILKNEDYLNYIFFITYKSKKILNYTYLDNFILAENNWFLYFTNSLNSLFQINLKDFSLKIYDKATCIFDIYFYKNFIIIYDEIEVLILNENLKILKGFDSKWIIEKFEIKENLLYFCDEYQNNFEFNLDNL